MCDRVLLLQLVDISNKSKASWEDTDTSYTYRPSLINQHHEQEGRVIIHHE